MQIVRYCLSGMREMLIFKKIPSDLSENEKGVNEK
jgi:hypothetical protein